MTKFSINGNDDLNIKVGIITDKLVLAVLDNGTVLDVILRALVGGEILGNGLVCLHALVSEEIYQPAEDSVHALQHGGRAGGGPWRPRLVLSRQLASGRAGVVFDITRQYQLPHALGGRIIGTTLPRDWTCRLWTGHLG